MLKKLNVLDHEIGYYKIDEKDYISLTDMVRNKNTIEFLGIWEIMYNKDFNSPEFGGN